VADASKGRLARCDIDGGGDIGLSAAALTGLRQRLFGGNEVGKEVHRLPHYSLRMRARLGRGEWDERAAIALGFGARGRFAGLGIAHGGANAARRRADLIMDSVYPHRLASCLDLGHEVPDAETVANGVPKHASGKSRHRIGVGTRLDR
jgi:hypothetical protein